MNQLVLSPFQLVSTMAITWLVTGQEEPQNYRSAFPA